MYVEQIYTGCLAEASYYIESDGEVAIIDPIRETEPYLQKANTRSGKIKYVFETHFHADFVSGHIDLAKKSGGQIVYGPQANTAYEVYNAKDGEVFSLGKVKITALHTPGHTPESTCYLLTDEHGKDYAIFTGDTLFVGDVGRPDLLDGVMSKEDLAGMMYESLNNKIKPLADDVIVYPAHGPGSACGKNIGSETFSTIGEQRAHNYALQEMSKEEFIAKVTEGIVPPPKYFFEDARINKQGYQSLDEVLEHNLQPLSAEEFGAETANSILLDTRGANDFEKGFIPGSVNIGLDGDYAVWVGTLLDINKPIVLVTDEGKEKEAVARLARVGFENVRGYLDGGFAAWKNANKPVDNIQSIAASEVKQMAADGAQLLDVRRPGEWSTSHVSGAKHLSLANIEEGLNEFDPKQPYLVHCLGGYRSMIASSILKKHGFEKPINVYGGFREMAETDLKMELG